MTYPYSDEFMKFDEKTHRYILQEEDLIQNLGIDLASRKYTKVAINSLLNQISTQVYSFIHKFNVSNDYQDWIIANTCSGREIIKEAMEEQLKYVLINGDLRRSTDKEKRALWFDDTAREILERIMPEIGCTILYTGQLPGACI